MRFYLSSLGLACLLACFALAGCSDSPSSAGGGSGVEANNEADNETNNETNNEVNNAPLVCVDEDGDGFGENCDAGFDCNDQRSDVNAQAEETCDGIDNNCDGDIDPGCPCSDGAERSCYTGSEASEGVGVCRRGVQTCVGGSWAECLGQITPTDERCNGLDDNCDGQTDEGLLNACGACGETPAEECGDVLDNNCDGRIDESEAGCTCDGRTRQPCYGGPPQTLGVGQCRGGFADCEGSDWGTCAGQVLPEVEVCDGIDNDCDGLVDEGLRNACGACEDEDPDELCDGFDNDCDTLIDEGLANACGTCGAEVPEEACGDGLDNDCDGLVDEGCSCRGEETCYPGPELTRNVGACAEGTRTCEGEFWSECNDAVTPTSEVCDGVDNDCDGLVDEGPGGCSICGPQQEVCDGIDNDCDGFIDEFVTNSCGRCDEDEPEEICGDGLDNDCDGLEDEGLLNACGTCGDSCYQEEWTSTNGRLPEGELQGVEDDGNGGGLRLGRSTFTLPFIWIANSAEDTVSKLNTVTGQEEGRYTVGDNPSRTAVDLNGDVWVANRNSANVHRIRLFDCEGQACVDPPINVGSGPRGVAVDANNNIWVGSYNDRNIMKINSETMQVETVINVPGNVYGLAIDAEGNLWTSERGGGVVSRINTETSQLIETLTPPFSRSLYGIAIDGEGNLWLGNFTENNILKYNPRTSQWQQFRDRNGGATRGIAVDGQGNVWVANSSSNNVSKFRASDGAYLGTYPVGNGPIGVAIDNDGNIWAVNQGSSNATKLSPEGQNIGSFNVGSGPYTYSDMTGFQLRNFTVRQGRWTVVFDCGYTQCQFDNVVWLSDTPADTQILLSARSSTDRTNWSPQVGPFNVSPAALTLPRGRYLELEVELTTTNNDLTPVFYGATVYWQRP